LLSVVIGCLFDHTVHFAVEENFFLLHLFLGDEGRFRNGVLIALLLHHLSTTKLILDSVLLIHSTLDLAIRFTVENHLAPSVILFEHIDDVSVMEVLGGTRIHESTIF
jgi:hypothetical protein